MKNGCARISTIEALLAVTRADSQSSARLQFDFDEDSDEHPRAQMQRHKFSHGGRNVYKEEDWVSHWWRQQPNSWADDFKTFVEEISLVRVNSAMVERLWSMYNARHKDHGHAFGPGERQRVVKKRWAGVHRRGGR